jgi:hypothetical protein
MATQHANPVSKRITMREIFGIVEPQLINVIAKVEDVKRIIIKNSGEKR